MVMWFLLCWCTFHLSCVCAQCMTKPCENEPLLQNHSQCTCHYLISLTEFYSTDSKFCARTQSIYVKVNNHANCPHNVRVTANIVEGEVEVVYFESEENNDLQVQSGSSSWIEDWISISEWEREIESMVKYSYQSRNCDCLRYMLSHSCMWPYCACGDIMWQSSWVTTAQFVYECLQLVSECVAHSKKASLLGEARSPCEANVAHPRV